MALSRHNSASGQASSTNTVSGSLAVSSGEIVIVQVNLEDVSGSGAVKTVTGVSDGVNTYAKRFSASQTEPIFSAVEGFEVWWAYATTTTTLTITATLSASIDDAVILVAGYQGFTGTAYQTNPWDVNASLPKTAQSTGAASFPSATGVSTTSTAGMLLAGAGSCEGSSPTFPTGFSLVKALVNSGASNQVQGCLFDSVYSSAQSSVTVTTATNQQHGWIFWVDALTIPSGATNPSHSINISQAVKRSSFW